MPERPVKNKVRKQHFEQILKKLEYIFESETKKDRFSVFIEKWNKLYRYFNNLRGKIDNYTYFFKYSCKLRSYFSTTNWIGRGVLKILRIIFVLRGISPLRRVQINFYIYFLEIRT